MADKKISQLTDATTPLTGTEELAIVQGGSTVKATAQDIADLAGGGGGLAGTNYIYVMADGTDTDNATELQAAYTAAVALSPSATSRVTIVAGPGYYNFDTTPFTMDTEYIDLVSLDGNRSVVFNSADPGGTISITANDVFVKGVDVETKNFTIADSLNLLRVENCIGGDYSFNISSLGNGIASGTFNNCQGGDFSFGGGGSGTLSGKLYYCRLTAGTFETVSGGGRTIYCIDGNDTPNNQ